MKQPEQLERFDHAAACPKCGHRRVETAYCKGGGFGYNRFAEQICDCDVESEHLHRRCRRCGYIWEQATLDADVSQVSIRAVIEK